MNKKRFLKVLIVSMVMLVAMGLVASKAMASLDQARTSLGDPNSMSTPYAGIMQAWKVLSALEGAPATITTQEMMEFQDGTPAQNGKFVPAPLGPIFLLDNFQYWKEPRSMGWSVEEPDYPVYGAGVGYGILKTVVDFEEGSRVLDVSRPTSVFLPFNNPQLMPYRISKAIDTRIPIPVAVPPCFPSCTGTPYCGVPLAGLYNELSFKVRAPLAIEQFDTFRMEVNVILTDGSCATIALWPRDKYRGCNVFNADSVDPPPNGYVAPGIPNKSLINVYIGGQFADGSWHLVMVDLDKVIQKYTVNTAGLLAIVNVEVRGNVYRLDDIMFTIGASSIANNHPPYLFRVGPVYATLYGESQSCPPGVLPSTCVGRLIFAQDPDLHMTLDSLYDFTGAQYSTAANPSTLTPPFAIVDVPEYLKVNGKNPATLTLAQIGANLVNIAKNGNLRFSLNINDPLGASADRMATPIPIVTSGGVATAVNTLQAGIMAMPQWEVSPALWVRNLFDVNNVAGSVDTPANPMYALVSGLVTGGYTTLPGALLLRPAQSQVFEDLILCCRVTDGLLTDEEVFPVSVVNYAVTNLPPLIEQLEDQFFTVALPNTYQITATDPDLQDMGQLTYRATVNGMNNYQYGPWINSIINPISGTVSFTPQFEGALTCQVIVSDPRGMSAVGNFTIFCVNGGASGATWMNHAPIVAKVIQSPQEVRAGEMFILKDLHMADPDNQPLYYSCNVGAVGTDGIYAFQSEFPGQYLVQITGYDPMGGAVTQQFVLNVMPFWSI